MNKRVMENAKIYQYGLTFFRFAVMLLYLAGYLCMIPSNAAALSEYDLKAAFVFNFGLFAQWPHERFHTPNDPVQLLVFGNEEVRDAFLKIEGKSIGSRVLEVSFAENVVMAKETLATFHMVFISKASHLSAIRNVLQILREQPILTIGERTDFLKLGGMVNFFERKGRLYFEVQLNRVQDHGVKLSSRLLNLAIIVNEE